MKTCLICFLLLSYSLAAFAQNPDTMPMASLDSMAKLLYDEGRYGEALPYAQKSADLAKKLGNDTLYARKLYMVGQVYGYGTPYEKAETAYLEAMAIFKKQQGEQSANYLDAMANLADVYRKLNKLEQSEQLHIQCKQLVLKYLGEDSELYTYLLNSLAIVYSFVERYEESKTLYLQFLEKTKKRKGEYNESYANGLQNLGALYRTMKDYPAAEKAHLRVKEIKAKVFGEQHPGYGLNLSHLASLYAETNRLPEAEKNYKQVFEIWKNALGINHLGCVSVQLNLGKLYIKMQQMEKADSCYQYSIRLNCENKDSNLMQDWTKLPDYNFSSLSSAIEALRGLSQVNAILYKQTKDINYLQKQYLALLVALRLSEKNRNKFTNSTDKLRATGRTQSLVAATIPVALALDPQQYNADLFAFVELTKASLLTDATKAERARNLGDLPDSLINQELDLQTSYDALKKQEAEARKVETKEKIKEKLSALQLEITAFETKIKKEYPKYHALKYAQITVQANEIQQLIDEKTLFLEYFVADSLVYLFTLDKKSLALRAISMPSDTLKTKINQLRTGLTNYELLRKDPTAAYQTYTAAAFWFYEHLLKPAQIPNHIQQLIIVTDGELGHIPFETFLLEPAPAQLSYNQLHYLVKDFKLSYNYSATLWRENQTVSAKRNNGQIYALAANYDSSYWAKAQAREPAIRKTRQSLSVLPAVQQEVEFLQKLFAGKFCLDTATNEADFKAQASQYAVVHLAMHGILNKKSPILSSLAFTEIGDSAQDNFLEAWEIARLKLNADLVVLSACETGYGKFQKGEGVMSLARSFMYAGTPALVVSMWAVNDASTALLMEYFYKNIQAGQDKANALRNAKLQYLSNAEGVAAHPAFWSPFVLLGDSRPIYIASKSNAIWWWSLGCIGLVAVLGGLFWTIKRKRNA